MSRQTATTKKDAEPDPAETEQPEVEQRVWPKPTNVIEALAQVQERIGGIRKLTPAQRRALGLSGGSEDGKGIKYGYRGIDQIASAAQKLFGECGIVCIPHKILDRTVDDIQVANNPWTNHFIAILWRIYGPGGREDFVEAETVGEGRDNSDKGTNKSTTGAHKNLLLKVLCIGDPDDDPDNERHENDNLDEIERVRQEEAEEAAKLARQERLEATWAKSRRPPVRPAAPSCRRRRTPPA